MLLILALFACKNGDPVDEDSVVEVQDSDSDPDLDGDGSPASEDCDDSDAAVRPDAIETCDGIDNDCDEGVDEGVQTTWWADEDEDGFGAGEPSTGCEAPEGSADNDADCDDTDPQAWPEAEELCDGVDQDCDGAVDEGVTFTVWVDADADGYGDEAQPVEVCGLEEGTAEVYGDCDDTRDTVSPALEEACDGLDNDCDETVDESLGEDVMVTPDGFEATLILEDSAYAFSALVVDPVTGNLLVTNGGSGLYEVDPATGTMTLISSNSLIKQTPNEMVWGDGVLIPSDQLMLSEHNATSSSTCCEGSVYQVDPSTGSVTTWWTGSPSSSGADPKGLAFPTDTSAWGEYIYVSDTAGDTSSLPQIWRGNSSGRASFVRSSSTWSTSHTPQKMGFAPDSWGNELYIYNSHNQYLQVVTASGSVSSWLSPGAGNGIVWSTADTWHDAAGDEQLYMVGEDLVQIAVDGTTTVWATPPDGGNDLAFSADGETLYLEWNDGIIAIDACEVTE